MTSLLNQSMMRVGLSTALAAMLAAPACGQTLARRVESANGSTVQFHFASHGDACGDGRSFIRIDGDSWIGTFNDATRNVSCERGPVRVQLVKSGQEIVRIETDLGPLQPDSSATDLGRVGAEAAASYFMNLASSVEGRAAREALLPASLADSARIGAPLMALVKDQARPRDLRRSALTTLSRRRPANDAIPTTELVRLVMGIARDEQEHNALRQSAISMLARLERAAGVPGLIELSQNSSDPWLARYATEAAVRSGDPRALRASRTLLEAENTAPEVRVAAMNALASEYGTANDVSTLRRVFDRGSNDRVRDAALNAAAGIGGTAARQWILEVVKNEQGDTRQRRRAASLLDRAGVSVAELIGVYDGVSDGELRSTLIDQLAQAGTKDARAKLVAIAKNDTQPAARRRAISALGRVDDPAVRSALQGLIERE